MIASKLRIGYFWLRRKSRSTVLLHFGQRGSASESMTYMRHLGHPTSTIEVASGLLEYFRLSSEETHERVGDSDSSDEDVDILLCLLTTLVAVSATDRFSFKSNSC